MIRLICQRATTHEILVRITIPQRCAHLESLIAQRSKHRKKATIVTISLKESQFSYLGTLLQYMFLFILI